MPPSARTISTAASSMNETQSHITLVSPERTSSARWPMAKDGDVPMPMRPGACWRNAEKCVRRIASSVVQDCPSGFAYCRSSWQIAQPEGGASEGGYCVPQVVQMKAAMARPPVRRKGGESPPV